MSEGKIGGGTIDVRLQNLADNIPGSMVFQMAAQGEHRHFLYVSRGVEALFGVKAEDALADAGNLYGLIDPAFIPPLIETERVSMATGRPFIIEVPLIEGKEHVRWIQISSARRLAPDGSEIWDGVVLDISNRKAVELAHAEAEQRLELATEAAAIGIWHWDLLTGRMDYSPRAKAIYGLRPDEDVTFDKLRALNVEADNEVISAKLQRALDPDIRENEIFTYRIRHPATGEVRWLMAHGRATFAEADESVRATSYVGTLQDVTDQKTAEEQLRESEARLRLAISAGAMAVWELDVATEAVTPSRELNALYGFPPDAHPSLADFRARYAPGEVERIEAEAAAVMQRGGAQLDFEAKHIWPDGSVKWFTVRAQIISDPEGVPKRLIGVVMDVTQRRSAEERLQIVARELHHRVKNSLSVVQSLAAQTFKTNRPIPEAMTTFTGRLQALAAATDVMTRTDWSEGSVKQVVELVIGPYRGGDEERFDLSGEDVAAPSKVIVGVGMALHELCTNAVKYGALSSVTGKVKLGWSKHNGWLDMQWTEIGGPPVTAAPQAGFGTRLLRKGIFEGAAGEIQVEFLPEGVRCAIRARLSEAGDAR